jgi:protein involved in polysaccharide export with SLBB domain
MKNPIALVVLLLVVCSGCKTQGGPPLTEIAEAINSTLQPNEAVLAPGDQISVRFPFSPTWDQTLQLTPSGTASFMGIGDLHVAGMTVSSLRSNLMEAYSYVIENPDLNVELTTVAARTVYVMGEVLSPGEFLVGADRRLTLIEALARAGGPRKETAYLEHTLLVRWSAKTGQQMAWKLDATEDYWTGSVPLYLQPYDVVFIPNTPVDEVAIWVDNHIRRMIPFPYVISTGN